MAAAYRLLGARPRSERELRERLSSREWADRSAVDDCIKRLSELGFINDRLMAQSYAGHRLRSKPVGRARLARELAGKKLSASVIDEAVKSVFQETDEEELIDRALAKRLRVHGKPSDEAAKRRLFAHLARLGFEYELIIRKLRKLKVDFTE